MQFIDYSSLQTWLQCNRPITGAEGRRQLRQFLPEGLLLSVANHLIPTYGFPYISLRGPGGCIDRTGPIAERQ